MADMSVDLGRVLQRVTQQRNVALDEGAKAMAKVEELHEEVESLKAQLAGRDTSPTVVPGTVEG